MSNGYVCPEYNCIVSDLPCPHCDGTSIHRKIEKNKPLSR
jgi:hypothetical protein